MKIINVIKNLLTIILFLLSILTNMSKENNPAKIFVMLLRTGKFVKKNKANTYENKMTFIIKSKPSTPFLYQLPLTFANVL